MHCRNAGSTATMRLRVMALVLEGTIALYIEQLIAKEEYIDFREIA